MEVKIATIAEIGEFNLIERVRQLLPQTSSSDLILGIGDDAAAFRVAPDMLILATCDIQVEGTHFILNRTDPRTLGRRAMAVNLSDIAAMGGRPTYALVSLALPESLPVAVFDELVAGMGEELASYSAAVIGGNLSRTQERLVIDVFMLGEVHPDRLLTRSGANPGDRLFVTGSLGGAAVGLRLLEASDTKRPSAYESLVQAHLKPEPRIGVGQKLAAAGAVTAMIDISDGLVSDLSHICEQSGVGAELFLDSIPHPPNMTDASILLGIDASEMALYGGEDYELLFTLKPDTPDQVVDKIRLESGVPITEIGRILENGAGCWGVASPDVRRPLNSGGWDHFGKGAE